MNSSELIKKATDAYKPFIDKYDKASFLNGYYLCYAKGHNPVSVEAEVDVKIAGKWEIYSIPDSMPCIKEEVLVKYIDGSYGLDYWDEEKDLRGDVIEFMRIP